MVTLCKAITERSVNSGEIKVTYLAQQSPDSRESVALLSPY
ncbi:hypothetical protein FRUB_07412 [Fimbriiglobus ruber]|uniref:Uncharacterized protein n=1 Tax=Fimbriiglobus ruber TaxID=1908690 RepID=A0A225D9Z8_9BACT|nr:hypothetical protein FRUB_07412 [Fimbriiglobus ruber]